MGSSLRERAASRPKTAGSKTAPAPKDKPKASASTKAAASKAPAKDTAKDTPKAAATTEPKEAPKASEAPKTAPKAAPSEDLGPPKASSVDDIIAALEPSEVDALVARLTEPSEPFVAPVTVSRETKADQLQYDGRTPKGHIVRVWAPAGSPMLTTVRLDGPDVG